MRVLLSIALLFHLVAAAQPGPPTFCFVLAEDRSVLRPLQREVRVVQHFQERVPYVGLSGTWLKPEQELPLQGGPLFSDSTQGWVLYMPLEGMAMSSVLIIAGADTMRVDLPELPTVLQQQAMRRSTRDTPEVIRFGKGTYAIEELMVDPWAVKAAQRLTERLIEQGRIAYERYLVEQARQQRSNERAAPVVAPSPPPPSPTAEEIQQEIARRPGLKSVDIDRLSADTVWVRITGRVMLDGGCASGMPLFGIELRTDTGWVERLPMAEEQMDCGMPWADWTDHVVMIPPLRWWVAVHQPTPLKELKPGTYRLVLQGANMQAMYTRSFELR